MSNFQCISPDEAEALLEKQDCLLLDSRDIHDYRASHVTGALHAHRELLEELVAREDKSQPVVVYCYRGFSSQQLARALADAGYDQVFSVTGGFEGWRGRLGR